MTNKIRKFLTFQYYKLLLKKKKIGKIYNPNYIWCLGQSGSFALYDFLASSGCFSYYGVLKRKKSQISEAAGLSLLPQEGLHNFFRDVGLNYQQPDNTWMFNHIHDGDVSHIDIERVRQRYQSTSEAYSKTYRLSKKTSLSILDKSPLYLLMTHLLFSIFPNSKHIFLIRDPRSVFHSVMKRIDLYRRPKSIVRPDNPGGFYSNIFKREWIYDNNNLEENELKRIIWLMNAALDEYARYGKFIKVVFYEDILTQPKEVITSCLHHFNQRNFSLDYLDNALNGLYKPKTIDHASFMERTSHCQKELITSMNKLINRLGYDVKQVGKRMKPSDISNQYIHNSFVL